MAQCNTSPQHTDSDNLAFDPDKLVSVLLDGDPDTVKDITEMIMEHYRKSGKGFPSGRDSNRTILGGYGVRFSVMGR